MDDLVRSDPAANLLLLWSHLNNSDLWCGFFNEALQHTVVISAELCTLVEDAVAAEMAFVQATQLLRSYSLIAETECDSSQSVHAVAHRWTFHHRASS